MREQIWRGMKGQLLHADKPPSANHKDVKRKVKSPKLVGKTADFTLQFRRFKKQSRRFCNTEDLKTASNMFFFTRRNIISGKIYKFAP